MVSTAGGSVVKTAGIVTKACESIAVFTPPPNPCRSSHFVRPDATYPGLWLTIVGNTVFGYRYLARQFGLLGIPSRFTFRSREHARHGCEFAFVARTGPDANEPGVARRPAR
jgi:hypothetical protein